MPPTRRLPDHANDGDQEHGIEPIVVGVEYLPDKFNWSYVIFFPKSNLHPYRPSDPSAAEGPIPMYHL